MIVGKNAAKDKHFRDEFLQPKMDELEREEKWKSVDKFAQDTYYKSDMCVTYIFQKL